MNARFPLIFVSLCLAAPAVALAETASPAPEFGGSILQVILSLILVVLLLFGSLYVLKKLSAPRGVAAGLLRVIAGAAVGSRERVVVVEIGDTWLVLGVAPGSITALHQLPRRALPSVDEAGQGGKDFAGWLKQVMDRRNAH
ncbi:MAG: flagellar biosynthetic protein FliO [Rhodocyclaceae bacterium]|nr:MAG: flagellar biosynthetic protein FliO [Rhodocyclaceae bacterium]